VARLRRAIPTTDRGLRDRAAIELGLQSLRISEVLGLDLDDLYLGRKQVRITGKGGTKVYQSITKHGVDALQEWLARRPACASRAVFIPLPPRRGACRLHATMLEDLLHGYLKAAGIDRDLSFHGLRHTVGVLLADKGVNPLYIQDLLRHRNAQTTRRYTRVARHRLSEVLDRALEFPE